MARWQGTTAQRGLGTEHQRDKKRLQAQLRDGQPCWRCGLPMYRWQELDRDHITDRARGGAQGPAVLAHASCNRKAGAQAGNQRQARLVIAARPGDVRCAACGQTYHYAARSCAICGKHYHPSGKTVRTCSRACGAVLRQLNARGQRAAIPCPACTPVPSSAAVAQLRDLRQDLPRTRPADLQLCLRIRTAAKARRCRPNGFA